MDTLLRLEQVGATRGVIRALNGVDLAIARGERVAVLGANGAGKTTLLRTITGLTRARSGHIWFDNHEITRTGTHTIASMGVALVPEGRGLFPELTTEQNLVLGGFSANPWRCTKEVRGRIDELYAQFPLLAQLRNRRAGALSGGQAQLVAIARGLVARPRLLLLDEPSTGLAPKLVSELAEFIESASENSLAILIVEQNLAVALGIAKRLYVLASGSVVFEASRQDFLERADVFSAYLGRHSTEQAVAVATRAGATARGSTN